MSLSRILKYTATKLNFSNNRNGIMHSVNYSNRDLTKGPLSGIRILDLTRVLAGPYCSMLLGDLGAEIIKVEEPEKGDDTRQWGPPFKGKESCYFLSVNRNKKSIGINMKNKQGVELIKKLASKSDVFIENFLPGKLDSFGLGYKELQKNSPKLVYCSITGFGDTGPYRNRAGYDVIAAASGGLLHITGTEDGGPCRVGVAITDICTGLYAHGAIMAALFERVTTGKGQKIDCNLLSTQVATLANISSNFLNCGTESKRWGTAHESIVPYQAFPTSDSHIILGTGNDKQFFELCKVMDLEHLITDQRFQTNKARVQHRSLLISELTDRFSTKTTSEWLDLFKDCKFPFGPINSVKQAFDHPQVLHNKMVVEMNHSVEGPIKVVGPAVQYSETGNFCRIPPPFLGEHTKHILGDILGISEADIKNLKDNHVVN